jgi:hypothetical protein
LNYDSITVIHVTLVIRIFIYLNIGILRYLLQDCTSKMGASGVASVVIAHMKLAKHSRYRAPAEGAGFGADGRDGGERERRRVRGEMD